MHTFYVGRDHLVAPRLLFALCAIGPIDCRAD